MRFEHDREEVQQNTVNFEAELHTEKHTQASSQTQSYVQIIKYLIIMTLVHIYWTLDVVYCIYCSLKWNQKQ